jgi:hypothetical protein
MPPCQYREDVFTGRGIPSPRVTGYHGRGGTVDGRHQDCGPWRVTGYHGRGGTVDGRHQDCGPWRVAPGTTVGAVL